MTEQEFAELLGKGYETRAVEFKGPGMRDDRYFFAKVARAVLGMSNQRGGGTVIVGVEDDDGQLTPVGLSEEEVDSWRYDDVAALLATYCDPTVDFDLEVVEYQGKNFLVLRVHEFDDVPILCKKDCDRVAGSNEKVLRKGACYVRSHHKPETAEIPTQEDMRDLLDLAIEKGVRRFLERAHNSGLSPEGVVPEALPAGELAEENYPQKDLDPLV